MNEKIELCECGCGGVVTPGKRFIHNHHRRGKKLTDEHKDKIGLSNKGKIRTDETKRKLSESHIGKSSNFTGKHHTDESRDKIRNGHKGVELTNEHKLKISEGVNSSDKFKAATEEQIGGHDIVGHHMIYDHSDLTKNIMPMTRSMHTRLHNLLRKNGIEIPHINIKEEL